MNDERQPTRFSGVLAWIVTHPKTTICVSILTFLLLLVVLFDHLAESRLEKRIAAIRARGEPTCAADLAAAMPKIPDEENMALRIEELGRRIEAVPVPEEWNNNLPIIGSAKAIPTGRRLPPKQLEAAKWYLAKFPEELAAIHEALKLERGCPRTKFASPLIDNLFAQSTTAPRSAWQAVNLEVVVAAEDGDREQAGRILLDLCRAKRAYESASFAVDSLTKLAVVGATWGLIERTINRCGLDETTLRLLQAEVGSPQDEIDFRSVVLTERAIFIDTMQYLRTSSLVSNPSPDGMTSTRRNPWRYVPIVPAVDAAEGLKICDKVVEAIDKPDADSIRRLKAAESGVATLPDYCPMSRVLTPHMSRAAELWVRGVGLNRAMQAAMACERYRLSHGECPADLDALVPEYLAAVPLDPFDGQPIRYNHIPEGICVWCIGEDLVDNGGDVMRLEIPKAPRRASDFGWVLLNPELRGLPAETEEAKSQPATASAPAEQSVQR